MGKLTETTDFDGISRYLLSRISRYYHVCCKDVG